MRIQLDTHAMQELFKPGTEAEVELQQAVLQNIINRSFVKMSNSTITTECARAANQIKLPNLNALVQAELESMLVRQGYGNPALAHPKLETEVRNKAEQVARGRVEEIICEGVAKAKASIEENVTTKLQWVSFQLEKTIAEKLDETVAKAVNARFDEIIKIAIAERFKL